MHAVAAVIDTLGKNPQIITLQEQYFEDRPLAEIGFSFEVAVSDPHDFTAWSNIPDQLQNYYSFLGTILQA